MDALKFAIGDRVRVSRTYWDASIRGATGIIVDDEHVRGHIPPGAFWVEFDTMIPGDDPAHPTDAAAVEVTGLELIR
jgi:hypothetical protein